MPGGGMRIVHKGRKTKSTELGSSLIKSHKQARKNGIKLKTVTEGEHYIDKLSEALAGPLKSVIEVNTLDEFLYTAKMADRRFEAERNTVVIIGGDKRMGDTVDVTIPIPSDIQDIPIPRRPKWTEEDTAETLDRREKDSFLSWRRGLAEIEQKNSKLAVTPFEKNIEVWRQLWRVVERSDVISQVIDCRNPLLYRCLDLERYVKAVDENKECLLILNKADYLNFEERKVWAEYFLNAGVEFVFVSAKIEQQKLDETARIHAKEEGFDFDAEEEKEGEEDINNSMEIATGDADEEDEKEEEEEEENEEEEEEEEEEEVIKSNDEKAPERNDSDESDEEEDLLKLLYKKKNMREEEEEETVAEEEEGVTLTKEETKLREEAASEVKKLASSVPVPPSSQCYGQKIQISLKGEETETLLNKCKVLDRHELLEFFESRFEKYQKLARSKVKHEDASEGRVVVGMVGFPNVGKSSIINVLVGASAYLHGTQRVAVGPTPGKTKHFQTLILSDACMLCDCPGLVFPSFVHTKAEMLIAGVLPTSNMREVYIPIATICKLIPRRVFEYVYNISLPRSVEVAESTPVAARTLLQALCIARGFMGSYRSGPDESRGAREVIQDFVSGKLLYVHLPPGYTRNIEQEIETENGEDTIMTSVAEVTSDIKVEDLIDVDDYSALGITLDTPEEKRIDGGTHHPRERNRPGRQSRPGAKDHRRGNPYEKLEVFQATDTAGTGAHVKDRKSKGTKGVPPQAFTRVQRPYHKEIPL